MEASALTHSTPRPPCAGRTPLLRLQSDERLIAMTRRGQHAAFEALCSRYQSRLLSFCRHMLNSREDAEDVLQEVFAAAFNAVLADEREINVRPWLYRIARNRSLNHLRRASAVGVDSMDIHFADHGMSTGDRAIRRESFRELLADVHDLPETQRTALLLREIDALSYEQIAQAMETTVPSVKSLLVRARISLAEAAEARKLSCAEVRLELGEVAEGLTKPTAPARRHVRSCDRCRSFKKQLKENNHALAAVLPVAPLLIFKKLILAKLGSASAGSAHVAGGAGATVGAGAAAGAAGAGSAAGGIFTRRSRRIGNQGRRRACRRCDRQRRSRRCRPDHAPSPRCALPRGHSFCQPSRRRARRSQRAQPADRVDVAPPRRLGHRRTAPPPRSAGRQDGCRSSRCHAGARARHGRPGQTRRAACRTRGHAGDLRVDPAPQLGDRRAAAGNHPATSVPPNTSPPADTTSTEGSVPSAPPTATTPPATAPSGTPAVASADESPSVPAQPAPTDEAVSVPPPVENDTPTPPVVVATSATPVRRAGSLARGWGSHAHAVR